MVPSFFLLEGLWPSKPAHGGSLLGENVPEVPCGVYHQQSQGKRLLK